MRHHLLCIASLTALALGQVALAQEEAAPRRGLNGQPLDLSVPVPARVGQMPTELATLSGEPGRLAAPPSVNVPAQITYQGYLTDASGLPLSGPVTVTFNIYADAFDAVPVYTQTDALTATDGVVTTILGILPTSIFNGRPLYLGIQINGGPELAPRTPLVSLPYAIRAGFTDRLDTLTTGEKLLLGQPVNGQPGRLEVYNRNGDIASLVTFNDADGGFISVRRPNSADDAVTLNTIDADNDGQSGGSLQIFNDQGEVVISAAENSEDGGDIRFYNADGVRAAALGVSSHDDGFLSIVNQDNVEQVFIGIDPNNGFGEIIVNGIRRFDVAEVMELTSREGVQPGMVMVMDPDTPGNLRVSTRAYDRLVAGVISGAGDSGPGLILGSRQDGSTDLPLSITGIVEVWADADPAPIHAGDLLTTADRPGHAMAATDQERSRGAILGKAMQRLESGQGLIRVLVTLQ